ncbi:ATP synthase subunit 9 mitochondrial [Bienertia sinuspersici]
MEGEKKNFRSTSSPSTSISASGDPERDPERARLLLLYEGLYKSLIQDVRAEAELLLKKKLNFQTVSGLVQQRVPKVGTDYEIISDMKIELGPDHPLVHSSIHSVARNPSLAKQLFGYAILGFALTEAIALFAYITNERMSLSISHRMKGSEVLLLIQIRQSLYAFFLCYS